MADLKTDLAECVRLMSKTTITHEAGREVITIDYEAMPALHNLFHDHGDELLAAERDARRLEWLAHHGAAMRQDPDPMQGPMGLEGGGWFVLAPYHTGIPSVDSRERFPTMRAAIDAAMRVVAGNGGGD